MAAVGSHRDWSVGALLLSPLLFSKVRERFARQPQGKQVAGCHGLAPTYDDDAGEEVDPTPAASPIEGGEPAGSKPTRPLLRIGSRLGRQGPKD